jgi:hypothetical protein
MPNAFENSQEDKIEDETALNETAQKRIDRVAEKAAEKALHTEQCYDQDHPIISK